MKLLLATNNMVTISVVESLLRQAGITFEIMDQNMSVLEGSIGIIPRRIMVDRDQWDWARKLMVDAGLVVLAAFVSPYKEDRQMIREIVGASQFHEIHISTPIEVCEARDVKGLYAKARAGEILDFTGVNAPYEAPDHPALAIDTSEVDIEQAASLVMGSIIEKLKSDNE